MFLDVKIVARFEFLLMLINFAAAFGNSCNDYSDQNVNKYSLKNEKLWHIRRA